MRIRLSCNSAGDIRLQCLRDKAHISPQEKTPDAALVRCQILQEMTTCPTYQRKNGFGLIGTREQICKSARQKLREAGAILETGPKENCIFLTGTLPGSTKESLMALAAWSGWAVQTVTQWIRDFAPGAGYFGVWEYQKRGALHIHLCIRTETAAQAVDLKRRWKKRWIKVLRAISKRAGVDVMQREDGSSWADSPWAIKTDAQTVEKSVGSYLSKYLSKGSQKNRKLCYYPPSAWAFVARPLTERILHARLAIEVPQLAVCSAINLFERLGAAIATVAEKNFPYESPFMPGFKAIISLTTPDNARAIFNSLRRLLGCYGGLDYGPGNIFAGQMRAIADLFGSSRVIAAASA